MDLSSFVSIIKDNSFTDNLMWLVTPCKRITPYSNLWLLGSCCLFGPATRCFTCCLLVKIIFFSHNWKKKRKGKKDRNTKRFSIFSNLFRKKCEYNKKTFEVDFDQQMACKVRIYWLKYTKKNLQIVWFKIKNYVTATNKKCVCNQLVELPRLCLCMI